MRKTVFKEMSGSKINKIKYICKGKEKKEQKQKERARVKIETNIETNKYVA